MTTDHDDQAAAAAAEPTEVLVVFDEARAVSALLTGLDRRGSVAALLDEIIRAGRDTRVLIEPPRRITQHATLAGLAAASAGAEYPKHGVGSLGHGYTPACDATGESCNNGQCRRKLPHPRCTRECTALVVWDATGAPWVPDAPNLRPPLLALADWTPATYREYLDALELAGGAE